MTQVLQIAVAVRDLDAAVRRYADRYGIGPWRILDCTPADIRDMEIHGRPRDYSMRIALCSFGGVDWELLEPSDEHSIYAEFLREHGVGLHHVGFDTPEWESSMRFLEGLGVPVRMRGNWGGEQEYRYLGTEDDLGFLTEVFHTSPGFKHPEPQAVYPTGSEAEALRPLFRSVRAVALVVPDLRPFVQRYLDPYGLGPWTCWRSSGFPGRKAACPIGAIEWTLIEPDRKGGGSNVYLEFLRDRGKGLHHVVLEAVDFPEALEALQDRGVALRATGDWMDGRPLLYADTTRELGCAVALVVPATVDREVLGVALPAVHPETVPI